MTSVETRTRLDRPVDETVDHVLGPRDAPITLVEYGSYACPHCRAANERIIELRQKFGDRLRYVFRHRPISNSELARRAAVLAEEAGDEERFWDAHVELMTRSETLTEDDLRSVAEHLELRTKTTEEAAILERRGRERVAADEASARESGVLFTPTFFINGRRYEGLWEESSFADAMLGSLGHRVRSAALDFARWAPSAGLLLLLATIAAVVLTNSPLGPAFAALWEQELGVSLGDRSLRMSLLHWINDGLLTLFFLVVGLEIKRELTVGHLSSRRSAALPVAAALGGMAVPIGCYLLAIGGGGPWSHGWGVPMATDTAFAVALIVVMGSRVPVGLRIFLTAAAIVDDIGAITVVAIFYSHQLNLGALAVAAVLVGGLALLHRANVYSVAPYVLLGVLLWLAVLTGGLHATMAGVLLAMFIPTRPPPNLDALRAQASAVLAAEARRGGEVLQSGPSEPALQAIDAIHDRLESPADRMLRTLSLRSSYVILPLFALANAGVAIDASVLDGRGRLLFAIVAGLVVGKPVGILLASMLAVRLGIATKSDEYDWRQVAGAGALGGIGFTMSLFIAGEAFVDEADFATAKIAVFTASLISAAIGTALLWRGSRAAAETPAEHTSAAPAVTPGDVTAL